MIQLTEVNKQLKSIGLSYKFFAKPEVRELTKILALDEVIKHCTFGFYQGGSALLVATQRRIILLDKRPFFLNLEIINYEMIKELDYAGRLLDATIRLNTGTDKKLHFRSFADGRLHLLRDYVLDQIALLMDANDKIIQESSVILSDDWQASALLPKKRIGKFGVNAYAQNI